jgi:putative MATE family efflux protein
MPKPPPTPAPQESSLVEASARNIRRAVWTLAWPTIIANLLQNAASLINLYFVRDLGVKAMDAVAWGEQVMGLVFAVSMGISVGTTALVARFTGAREHADASDAVRQSLVLGAILGVLTMLALSVSGRVILRAMGATDDILPLGLGYYRLMMLAVPPFIIVSVCSAAFRGLGDTRTPLWILGSMNVVNILMDMTLIWGRGPVPAFGIRGAAMGSTLARVFAGIVFLVVLWRSRTRVVQTGRTWSPSLEWWRRIVRIGIPSAAQVALRTIAMSSFVSVLARMADGPAIVAAMSVGMRAEGLAYMPGMAFNVAAATLVGQNLGARKPEQANHAAWVAALQSAAVMTVMGLAFYVFAEPIAWRFAAVEARPYVVSYLRINAICEPFLALAMTLTGASQGAGDTARPMWVMVVTMWLVRLPPTWFFGLRLGYGAAAAWWAMSLSVVVQGLLMAAVWRTGQWREARV